MIDMKLTHEQSPSDMLGLQGPTGALENNGPAYPHGLSICLDSTALQKLAMGLPQVGDKFTLTAMVEVVEVSKEAGQIEDSNEVELQIQAMDLKPPEDTRNDQQKAHDKLTELYG